jgi:enediyne biosynthesis protein E4
MAIVRRLLTPLTIAALATAASLSIPFRHDAGRTSRKYLIEAMGGGGAALDYDGDGRQDLFFVNGAKLADPMRPGELPDKSDPRYWNRLYRNTGNGEFQDVTEAAGVRGRGYGMGVATGDYDNDGRPDLYVTNYGGNILYHNEGNGRFRDVTDSAGVAAGGWSTGAVFVDYDRDGKLDLFVARYLAWDFSDVWCGALKPGYRAYCHPDRFPPATHLLFHNEGGGVFRDVSQSSGIAAHPGKGLGVAIDDVDGDGWPDIAVANDSFPQQLFHNRRDGTFEEVGVDKGIAYDEDGRVFAGMGIDFGDYDEDGRPDLFINALSDQRYWLFRNRSGAFEAVSGATGIATITRRNAGWGAKFVDWDADGRLDLLIGQGHVMDNIEVTQPGLSYLQPLLLLRNVGGRFERAPISPNQPLAARGMAVADLNGDGAPDAVIACNDGPAVLAMNPRDGANHWVAVDLTGTVSNRDGIGGVIVVTTAAGRKLRAFVSSAGSYLSASEKRARFGLGAEGRAVSIDVMWPSGTRQTVRGAAADRVHRIVEHQDPR